jgi:iron complex outermembrane recepter protein
MGMRAGCGSLVRRFTYIYLAFVCLVATATPATAQTAPDQTTTQTTTQAGTVLEEVVVTGTRIIMPNMASASPIQVVTAEDIKIGGRTDVSDVIMQLPQNFNNSFNDFNGRTSGLTSAGGLTNADLRGLGPQRTLVLVNGRRLGPADSNTSNPNPAADLDQIPTPLIERVDVVTGGASATYGSDAIAGVINFIMKRDFHGVQVDGQVGENWHTQHNTVAQDLQTLAGLTPVTGTIRDGDNRTFSIVLGSNIDDGKGNVTAYLGYLQADPIPSGNRDFGGCQLIAVPDATGSSYTSAACSGSSNSNFFRVNGVGPKYSVLGSQFVPWNTVATNPPAIFNSQPYIYNGRDDLRYTAGFFAHLDLSSAVKPYAEFTFMDDRTDQKVAPTALFRQSNPLDPTGAGNYYINCSNPLLSAQQRSILCTPAQIAADTANPGSASAQVEIGRRNVEGGGREAFFDHTNYRAVVGAKGELGSAWTYDVYGQYYYTEFYNANRQYFNFQSITNALEVTGTAAHPVCISGGSCVPYNIFTDGAVTQEQLQYLYLTGTSYGTNSQRIVHVDFTGDLGRYGITSPWANDGLSVNAGYEHRAEEMAYDPDSGEQSGLLAGFGGAAPAIHQGYSVDEAFLELGGALVQDRPGVKALVFDTGVRRSDYSTVGKVTTGKFEVQYAPTNDVRLRASYQRAIRAPNLIELYNPLLVGQITSGDDPCAPSEFTNKVAASLQQCLHTLPANASAAQIAAFTAAYNAGNIPQGVASQLSQLQGGNVNLKPETADSYSVGATLNPSALPGFTGSIDYFQIHLKDQITTVPPGLILQECLNNGDPYYCSKIARNPTTFGLTGSSVASGGYLIQTDINVAEVKVRGVDVQGHYIWHLPADWGSMGFLLNGSYLLSSSTQPAPNAGSYDCAGLYGAECQTVNPRWRHVFRTTWATPWKLDLSATWRFLTSVSLDNNSSNPLLFGHTFINQNNGSGAINYFNARIPNYSYLDLSASWNIAHYMQLRAGINNVFDKDPPLITSEITAGGAANTFETYDTLGRQVYLAFTAKF